jgi:hypothetical protein
METSTPSTLPKIVIAIYFDCRGNARTATFVGEDRYVIAEWIAAASSGEQAELDAWRDRYLEDGGIVAVADIDGSMHYPTTDIALCRKHGIG